MNNIHQYPESVLCDLACMILSNITAYTAPCLELLKLEVEVTPIDDKGGYYPPQSRSVTAPPPHPILLLHRKQFLLSRCLWMPLPPPLQKGANEKDNCTSSEASLQTSVLSVFDRAPSSITEEKEYRHQKDGSSSFPPHYPFSTRSSDSAKYEYALASLLPFTEHPDTIRRGGVASTIK
jgi:hypothetical protein